MAIVEPLKPGQNGRRRLGLRSPATREPIGEITVHTREDVEAALARAKDAHAAWAKMPVAERAKVVDGAVDVLVARYEEVIDTICEETGKTRLEAMFIEVIAACDVLNHWSKQAPKDLADEKVTLHGYMRPVKKLLMHYRPLGVIGVITPWNGPFALAMNPTVQAILAGNAVILKPSEVAPHSGEWAARILHEAGVPKDLVQVLHGDGETGAALVDAGVDKISFTGSVRTGKKIAVACAEQLIPCTLELGGKDAAIVCADADLERAAAGAVFNSCFNTGHVCMGIERVYVVESVADEFERLVGEKVRAIKVGQEADSEVGSIFWDRQLPIIERHIEDARAKGAEIVVGGKSETSNGFYFLPTFVRNVNHDMELMREETFGPIVSVMRVKDEEEAIRLANDSEYGLSGSVWTKDVDKGIAIAKRMETGSVMVNESSIMYGMLEAPFGGLKNSGLGAVNGRDALRSYSHALPIGIDRWGMKKEDHWYPQSERTRKSLTAIVKHLFGTRLRKLPWV